MVDSLGSSATATTSSARACFIPSSSGGPSSPTEGAPPNWLPYVRVADCDQIAERALALQGKVLSAPNDIPNVGRATVLTDPTGASIAAIAPAN
jgi:predicted enzyme related to lactoylglutathione lyase